MKGIINHAAGSQDKLEIIYINKEGSISQRVIKILTVNDNKIKAYCYNKRQFRIFKLDNILSVGPIKKKKGA